MRGRVSKKALKVELTLSRIISRNRCKLYASDVSFIIVYTLLGTNMDPYSIVLVYKNIC